MHADARDAMPTALEKIVSPTSETGGTGPGSGSGTFASALASSSTPLEAWSNDALVDELHRLIGELVGYTKAVLLRVSAVYGQLLRRGVVVSLDGTIFREVVPRISAGTLAPEVAVAFAQYPSILKRVANLPLDTQRHLADGGRVAVVPGVGQAPTEMTVLEMNQGGLLLTAMHGGRLLTLDEQRAQLAARAKYGSGHAMATTPAATTTAVPASDEDVEELAERLDAAMREGNVSRPTPRWLVERVLAAGWGRVRAAN